MRFSFTASLLALLCLAPFARGQDAPAEADVNAALEQATRAAIEKVSPSVVQIETRGGTELIGSGPRGQVRKGVGPTTGVVVAPDGYVISSAFNFANKPSAVFVSIPGKGRLVAQVVATDKTRMLTLLKVDANDLPVPKAVPKDEIRVGQWALAVGRTLSPEIDDPPSVSVGIISATGRVWGKAIQTDAKVSPVNYGGPLVAMDGRVQGIIVPASPQSEGETAGVEWYDSGIGFAIPMEDVFKILPRLREGKDLQPGLLGITPKGSDIYGAEPEIARVAPESAAERAGIKAGDVVLAIDGKPVVNQAQLLHVLRPKYEGDVVSLKVKRGDKELTFENITLTGSLTAFATPFLGILPVRDDPEPGVEVRHVFPRSPAEKAGIKPGDRVMKLAPVGVKPLTPFAGRDQMMNLMNRLAGGAEIQVEVQRKDGGKTETLTVKLDPMPADPPAEDLPMPSTRKKALVPPKPVGKGPRPKLEGKGKEAPKEEAKEAPKKPGNVETGLVKRQAPGLNRSYWIFVPEDYDPNVSYGLIIWLHPAGKAGADPNDMVDIWEQFCSERHYILLGALSENREGWLASEMEFVLQHARDVMDQYTIDRQRVVAHGMGVGGQMAFYLGFNARDLVRGVATTGAVLDSEPKENVPSQRLAFFVIAGEKDPLAGDIAEAKPKLQEKKFPVFFKEVKGMGKEYLDVPTFQELCRWLDSLDKM
ncbi:MAG TPA: PDZ domain-containing protein [Gemmataceae bacterium]